MRASDQQDFDAFVVARTPALLRTAFLLTGSRDAAQDLLQESLVRLHVRWGRVRDPKAREAYLRRILATRAATERRRRWHGEVATGRVGDVAVPDTSGEVDARHDALAMLRMLSPAHRAVLVLRFFEDLSEAQTAEALGCSVGTVKSRTSRALAQLAGPRRLRTRSDPMTDDDVVQLLERAAELAPHRLDREPVAAVARRRGRRRVLAGGVALTALVAAGAVVVPGLGSERQVLTPAAPPDVATEFFDLRLPVNEPDGGRWTACLDLPVADLVAGPATLSPIATVSVVGTAAERGAVEQCLRGAAEVTPVARPDLRAVRVSSRTDDPGPLAVSVSDAYPEQMTPFRVHDLTVQNTSSEPVHLDDPGFGEMLPSGLFIGIDCAPVEHEGAVASYCDSVYQPVTLGSGESRTFQVRLGSARVQGGPLPVGAHAADLLLRHRAGAPFRRPSDSDGGTEARVSLTYSVTGPSAPVDPARAAFRPSPEVFQDALLEGELGGDPASGCLWLTGPSGKRTPLLVLSDSASVDFAVRPFHVIDGSTVLAVEGEQVSLGGGFGLEPAPPGCPVTGGSWTGYFPQGG